MATIPYATAASIQSQSWSLELDVSAGGIAGSGTGLGKIVQGIQDIHQCLQIIFATIPGEDPFRPTFGCDLLSFLDIPLAAAIPAIVSAVTNAINLWEPRITIGSITASYSLIQVGQLTITVTWQPNLGNTAQAKTTLGLETTTFNVPG